MKTAIEFPNSITDINTATINKLKPKTQYFFNIVVSDFEGNKYIYNTIKAQTIATKKN